jgi:predicted Zn-dependent protease
VYPGKIIAAEMVCGKGRERMNGFDKLLKENDLELRHTFGMAHVFPVSQSNHAVCGRKFPNTMELGDYDAAVCKLCKDKVEALKEKVK